MTAQTGRRKLTGAQRKVLKFVKDGEYLSFQHIGALSVLEAGGFIEEIKSGFISQTHFRITEAGRTALAENGVKQ